MSDHETVRKQVSQAYAKAAARPTSSCCSGPVQKGVAAKLATYTPQELEALPPEALASSFGCGNPLAFSQVKEGDTVLDLGCGAGIDILIAGKKVGQSGRAIGVDMTDEMIAKARENVAAAGLNNVEIRRGIIEDLPVESSSVDWVISNCVINLSPDKPRVFAEIARVLKPGGRMRVSDIVVQDLPESVRQNPALYNVCIAGAISEDEYLAGLRAAGLVGAEARERLVYDAGQLKALIESELGNGETSCGCGCGLPPEANIDALAESVVGKVWSASIFARKPAD